MGLKVLIIKREKGQTSPILAVGERLEINVFILFVFKVSKNIGSI